MTGTRSITDVMAEFMAAHPAQPRRELHVSEHVWRFLHETYANAIDRPHRDALMGAPVVVDETLIGGQWQIRADGQVESAGDMAPAPPGMQVWYSRWSGWIAVSETIVAESETVGPVSWSLGSA